MKIASLFGSALPVLKKGLIEINVSRKTLSVREMSSDIFSIGNNIGFVAIPAFLAGLIFLLLPQGRDTLLLVTQQMTDNNYWPLFFLLISVFCWSIASEQSVRYSIYISDNSGKNLNDRRVFFRKTVQKSLAGLFLLWPYIVVMAGFIWNGITLSIAEKSTYWIYIGISILLLYVLMVIKTNLYFRKYGKSKPGISLKTDWGARSLPIREYNWTKKLYGIYNDYVYTLPKVRNFKGKVMADYQQFADSFLTAGNTAGFPQNTAFIPNARLVPKEFLLINEDKINTPKGELYKWVYRIPSSFYKVLHKRICRMAVIALAVIILIAFCPVKLGIFPYIGAPALICGAFACYSALYCGLLFLDKCILRDKKISARFICVLLFIITTVYNNDHPVRSDGLKDTQRPLLSEGFTEWFTAYKTKFGAVNDTTKKYPVVFVCAEGGAFRTGAYTGMFLTQLENALQNQSNKVDFRNSVFAMSGVSGGSVGLGYYNALAYRTNSENTKGNVEKADIFFSQDCLSPLIAKMFYGEFINLFIPVHIKAFDRAIALEESWEMAHCKSTNGGDNVFAEDFLKSKKSPLLVINTTEAETGRQCWITNMDMANARFGKERDLFVKKAPNVRYSTAINFSTRFPLFSPGGMLEVNNSSNPRRHYLDGGYVENTGSASMLEVMKLLQKTNPKEFKQIQPVVIYLLFSEEDVNEVPKITSANEIAEIINGIYNTRAGRSRNALEDIYEFVNENKGINIPLPLNKNDVPMNWVLSETSLDNIRADINDKLTSKDKNAILNKLPVNEMLKK